MKISFVIPCYNTGTIINQVLDEIEESMKERASYDYEIILVNDASPKPETLTLLKTVVQQRKNVLLVDLAKNSGQPNAIIAGCRFATGDYIMTSDDDGQTQLDKVGQFVDKIQDGYDVVCAKYTARVQKSLFRRLGSSINRRMADILIPRPANIYMSTIFMAKKFVIDEVIKYDQPYAYISGLILRVTQNIGNIDMEQRSREMGESGYTIRKLLSLWLNGFTAFSIKPLRVADLLGVLFAILGFVSALVTIIRKLIYTDISVGWSSIISIMLFSSGLTLLVLGLIGEYIGRIYMCINKTPQSIVRETFRSEDLD